MSIAAGIDLPRRAIRRLRTGFVSSSDRASANSGISTGHLVPRELRRLIEATVTDIPVDRGGGSTALKALAITDLIIEHSLETIVEIGVYRGRSLLPVAVALRYLGRGKIWGIDPFDPEAAQQSDMTCSGPGLSGVNDFMRTRDWEEIRDSVGDRIKKLGVEAHCELIRASSIDAAIKFEEHSLDLVHIDGNHDREAVALDLRLYEPRLRPGGFLILDDASWTTIRPAYHDLEVRASRRFEIFDLPGGNDFAIFQLT